MTPKRTDYCGPAQEGALRSSRRSLREFGAAFADLGTFLPHVLGAITVAGLAPAGVLFGFAAFYLGSGLFYGLPIPVQPMKAVSAVLLTSGLSSGEVAASGLLIGAALMVLSATGLMGRIARAMPQSVTSGLQLGLGLTLAAMSVHLMQGSVWLAFAAVGGLLLMLRMPALPAPLLLVIVAVAAAWLVGGSPPLPTLTFRPDLPHLVLPSLADAGRALRLAVLPQLALTVTNAVIVTAALAQDLFPGRAGRVSPRNLAMSSGLANFMLAPFGAMPMCHGAGGLAAHSRFGARGAIAPLTLGAVLLVLSLGFADAASDLFALVPAAAVGALLLFAAADLAFSRRLLDARPSCRPVIAVTAVVTFATDPLYGLVAGFAAEALRKVILRLLLARRMRRPAG